MSWNELFNFAQAVLGYTEEEAQGYANRKLLEQPAVGPAGGASTVFACVIDESGGIAELHRGSA